MATNHDEYDLLKNPAVDYDRTDLSARGILMFLVGLLVAGVFVELVIWGMFHFLARSPFFAKGNASPMVQTQKNVPLTAAGKDFENTTNINPSIFPEPRLQTNDVVDMDDLLKAEHKVLYAEQPFADQNGTIHLPINDAMKLIEQRGLPVRPAGIPAAAPKPAAAATQASSSAQ
jgi:hypothetical protein